LDPDPWVQIAEVRGLRSALWSQPFAQPADRTLGEVLIPELSTADHYVASVIDKHRVDSGPESVAHAAALEVMPLVKEWGANYLRGMTPSGAYAKGTAISLCTDIDLLIALKPIPGMEMRNVFWNLFEFLTGRNLRPEAHSVAMRVRHKGVKIDLVPACLMDGNPREHTLHNDSAAGIRTDVGQHVHLVSSSGRAQEICALKIWRERNSLDFPSLYLELTVLEALTGQRFGQLADNVLTILRYIAGRFRKETVRDPANEDNVISDSLTASEKGMLGKAAGKALFDEDWKRILW